MLLPMPMIVADCPRCKAKQITLDVLSGTLAGQEHGWRKYYELYCCCRCCFQGSIVQVSVRDYEVSDSFATIDSILRIDISLNKFFHVHGYVSLKDHAPVEPPEHLPSNVEKAFKEGATCLAVGCYNASGAMFRLAIDLASKDLLPEGDGSNGGPNRQQRKNLSDRLDWLFNQGKLPERDDGNDGAHDGTLAKAEAEDLLDFATELFERTYTEPERLRLAHERRTVRRSNV